MVLPEGAMTCMFCHIHERLPGRARCEACAKIADAEAKEKKKISNAKSRGQQGYSQLSGDWLRKRLR